MDPLAQQRSPALEYDDLPPGSRIACEVAGDELVITVRMRGLGELFRRFWAPFLMVVLGVGCLPLVFVLLALVGAPPPGSRTSAWQAARVAGTFAVAILLLVSSLFLDRWRRAELRLGLDRLVLIHRRLLRTRRYEWAREEVVSARAVKRLHLEGNQSLNFPPPVELQIELTGGRAVALDAAIPTASAKGALDRAELEWVARRVNAHLNRSAGVNG